MTFLRLGTAAGRPAFWLAFVLAMGVAAGGLADPATYSPQQRYAATEVTHLVENDHLSKHPLDAEIADRMLGLFLKGLDPLKMYFYKADVDAFRGGQMALVERVRKGDLNPAFKIFAVYLQRLDERVKTVEELLAQPHDFSVQEEMLVDRDAQQYPATPEEARDKWRKRVKYELLLLKADKDKIEGQAAIDKLLRRYHSLQKRMHQTDSDELLEMYLSSLTGSFDPHTSYMSPSTVENFDIVMKLELEGIGASLQFTDGYTVVNKLIPGGAAEKNGGLKVEDKIVAVAEGTDGEWKDVVDMKLSDVVKLIRGKRATTVRLKLLRPPANEAKEISIVRDKIALKDSEARAEVFEEGRRPDGQPYKVGVIDLPSFYMDMTGARNGRPDFRSTTRDVRRILEDFNRRGVDVAVLDLRRNGGGSLTEAINLTGLFIQEGPVVQVKGPEGQPQPYKDTDPNMIWSKPLVVVTSKFSASASEILAGAVQDYRRGLIVGDKTTHGKGTVQSLMDLGQQLLRIPSATKMGALKITVQQFYRPNGHSTQNRGVVADIELPSITTHLDVGEADLDYPMAFDQVPAQPYRAYEYVQPAIVEQLRARSAQRTAASADFQKVLRNIARYKEQKLRKTVTLNEKQFLEERAELNADKEEEKKIEEMSNAEKNGIERNFYLDEVMKIAAEYAAFFGQGQTQIAGQEGR